MSEAPEIPVTAEPTSSDAPEGPAPVAAPVASPAPEGPRSMFSGRGRAIALSALVIALSATAGYYQTHQKRYVLTEQVGADQNALTLIDGAREETIARGAKLGDKSRVRTGRASRVRIEHPDGLLVLERATEVTLGAPMKLHRGVIIAALGGERRIDAGWFNVARAGVDPSTGNIKRNGDTPTPSAGDRIPRVQITFGDDVASIESLDSDLTLSAFGKETTIPARREATLYREKERVDLATGRGVADDTMSLTLASNQNAGAIGELRAKKPGTPDEQGRALAISKQDVRVQISGPVARTEIEQVFTNDSNDELEGVYRFPLPAGAEFENLALEVDGKWVDGEFVERDRARAIWRGVIQNAVKDAPKPREQIIWVPGPWRDPALLEWQRGGRFELRIFPIPKKGERRVRIAYTEMLPLSGGARKYNYPMPQKSDVTIGRMTFEARVNGAPRESITTRGYDLDTNVDGSNVTLRKSADRFQPSGDLAIDVRSPSTKSLATTWTSADEGKRTFAIAIRPELPMAEATKPVHHIVVVDTGRGMYGSRYAKATEAAMELVSAMDRRDRFTIMACDLTCKTQDGGARVPSATSVRDVEGFLRGQTPDGATDVIAATERALSAPVPGGFERRVTVLSHGYGGLGARSDKRLTRALGDGLRGESRVVTVGLGSDGDRAFLEDVARAGRGTYVSYDASASIRSVARRVLGAQEGGVVSDLEIEWPQGIAETAPRRPNAIQIGSEVILAGVLSSEHVSGDVVLRGNVGGRPFESRIPIDLNADSNSRAAFVPRLYASLRTADLDREATDTSRRESIALSQKFHVPSKHTSLLVLESEAMFKSFGVERTAKTRSPIDLGGAGGSEIGTTKSDESTTDLARDKSPKKEARSAYDDTGATSLGQMAEQAMPAAKAAPAPSGPRPRGLSGAVSESEFWAERAESRRPEFVPPLESPRRRPEMPRPGRYMRQVWVRTGTVSAPAHVDADAAISKLRAAADSAPNERDKRAKLARKLAELGRVDDLDRELRAWEERDPFDLEMLVLRAEASLLRGNVDEALRRYSGILAVPNTSSFDLPNLTERVLAAFATRGSEHACALRLALAELRHDEAAADRAATCSDSAYHPSEISGGEVRASVLGESGDVDVIVIDSEGRHYDSTLGLFEGARVNVGASSSSPRIALEKAKNGSYDIIVRRRGLGPAKGKLRIGALGSTREMAYDLSDTNVQRVAKVQLAYVAQLVEVDGQPTFPRRRTIDEDAR